MNSQLILLFGISITSIFASPCWALKPTSARRALIIACSEFPFASGTAEPLPGVANDAVRFEQLLSSKKFAFDEVRKLAGWNEESDSNPTAENIVAAFESLIASTNRDDQVFIMMSGHGLQVRPNTSPDKALGIIEEPDGLDEAFVAADFGPEQKVIRDNQIGIWLATLKAKGAHTFIVFDCCHSGSLTRGPEDEKPKRLLSTESQELQTSSSAGSNKTMPDKGFLDLETNAANDEKAGSIVALFAAQNHETTPEVTKPHGAENKPENRHGLLSFHLEYLLQNASGQTTYRDLENSLASRYAAERGMRGPNPYLEGDLDRTLFGIEKIAPPTTIPISTNEGIWTLHGGVMDGVASGTLLNVLQGNRVIGEVEATDVGLNEAEIRWTKHTPESSEISDTRSLGCEITRQKINPWKVCVQWVSLSKKVEPPEMVELNLRKWTTELSQAESSPITVTQERPGEVWSLCVATPQEAFDSFGIRIKQTSILLLSDKLASTRQNIVSSKKLLDSYQFAAYSVEDLVTAKEKLSIDFDRLFRIQRLLQLAGLYGDGGLMIATRGVYLDFLHTEKDSENGESSVIADRGALMPGEEFLVQLSSKKPYALWYTVLLVESNGLVLPIFSGNIPKGASSKLSVREIERIRIKSTHNMAAYIAVTVPVKESRKPVNFSYLAQAPIGVHDQTRSFVERQRDVDSSADESQLGRLLGGSTRSSGQNRFVVRQDGSQIAVRAWSVNDQ